MKKILAILAVLCLGIVIMPSSISVAGTTTFNLLDALENDECKDATLVNRYNYNDSNYGNNGKLILTRSDAVTGQENDTFVIRIIHNQIANNSNIFTAYLELRALGFPGMAFSSLNVSVYYLYENFNESEVSWQYRINNTNTGEWTIGGGFYNPVPIYSVEMQSKITGWYQFNITTAYRNWVNNATENLGLIFRCTDPMPTSGNVRCVEFASSENGTPAIRPRLKITYSKTTITGLSSNITANKWIWLGYLNQSSKTGAQLYSEISNCQYVVMQNITTGYYYTYGPGIEEDFTITYGAAVAILVSSNSNWNHV